MTIPFQPVPLDGSFVNISVPDRQQKRDAADKKKIAGVLSPGDRSADLCRVPVACPCQAPCRWADGMLTAPYHI